MKNGFAEKLARIVEEARHDAPKAVYIALHMVHACYTHGKHRQLARYICRFSELEVRQSSIIESAAQPVMTIQ
jgi:hypothetical protein